MKLMKDWGHFNEKEYQYSSSSKLFCHLPEGFFQDLIDAFTEIMRLSPLGLKTFGMETIINIVEF
jgi:hypothetical protein